MLGRLRVLLPLAAGWLSATPVFAQDQSVPEYPLWVTNDYDCVIGCMQGFNETVTAKPSPETEISAYGCVYSKCNKDTMSMNIYQSSYIIQMFYATGSIYEDPNMGSWGQGSPPQNSAPPPASDPGGDDGGEGGQSGSESLSASTSQTDSATLTSTPATHPTSVSGTAITSTLSSAAPTGNTTSGFGKDLDGQKGGGSGHAMQTAWLAIAAGIFAAWFSDQGVGEL